MVFRVRKIYIVAAIFVLAVTITFLGCGKHEALSPLGPSANNAPIIKVLQANPDSVVTNLTSILTVQAEDPDGDELSYQWSVSAGIVTGQGANVNWKAPSQEGEQTISVAVSDGRDGQSSQNIKIMVIAAQANNLNPVITSLTAEPDSVLIGESSVVEVQASDPDGDYLTYSWTKTGGTLSDSGSRVTWIAPQNLGSYVVTVAINDGKGGSAAQSVNLIAFTNNNAPMITDMTADPTTIKVGGSSEILVEASDPDGDPLTYSWTAFGGEISGGGHNITWTAPSGPPCCAPGVYTIKVEITDGKGGTAERSVNVTVTL